MTGQERQVKAEIERLTTETAAINPLEIRDIEAALRRIGEIAAGIFPASAAVSTELLQELRRDERDRTGDAADPIRAGLIRLQEVFRKEAAAASGGREAAAAPALPGGGLGDDPELISDFVVEAREHLANIETNLLELEKNPALPDAVHSVFRSFHTIKGLTGFLALGPMHVVSHETESLLHHAREGRIPICAQLIDVTLKAADYVRVALDALTVNPPQAAMDSLVSNEKLINEIRVASVSLQEVSPPLLPESTRPAAEATPAESRTVEAVSVTPGAQIKRADTNRTDTSVVRVDTGKLEYLVEMVGELVIAQSMIHLGTGGEKDTSSGLTRNFAHLGRVTGEIQKTVLSMRMVPISRLYDKMARLVRDLARKSGKRIELRRIGDQVELDRNIVEEITDPFVHMIRNSIDHGIEDPENRTSAGKGETAYVTLEAFHQAGYIILRMSDDGRGLSTAKIYEKALQKGLIPSGAKLDDASIHKLIFEPGFSTAERVTDISGRGVGMDVVRRQIEKLRGTIEIDSRAGQGCCFTLKLPLTLAMVDGLILEAGGERYVLPIYSVREMFHITAEKVFTVENRAEMVLLRGSLLPVVRLDRFFASSGQGTRTGEIGIVVEGRTRQFCLVVDRMLGKQEVVIKTLGGCFKSVRGVAGGAILGDGRVGLILDVHGIDGGGDVNER